MALRIKYGKGKILVGKTKAKPSTYNNRIAYNVPNTADKINSTRGHFNKKRLIKENKLYNKQFDKMYNAELLANKQRTALRYATLNNGITQLSAGNTARDVSDNLAQRNSMLANRTPGSNQSSSQPGDISSNGGSNTNDSTSSLGWIK